MGKKGDYFLRVRGDSMINAHIYEGDLVFVKQTNKVESGSIAIVLVGEEATLKRVLYKKGLMILEAANPKIDTKVFYARRSGRIAGKGYWKSLICS